MAGNPTGVQLAQWAIAADTAGDLLAAIHYYRGAIIEMEKDPAAAQMAAQYKERAALLEGVAREHGLIPNPSALPGVATAAAPPAPAQSGYPTPAGAVGGYPTPDPTPAPAGAAATGGYPTPNKGAVDMKMIMAGLGTAAGVLSTAVGSGVAAMRGRQAPAAAPPGPGGYPVPQQPGQPSGQPAGSQGAAAEIGAAVGGAALAIGAVATTTAHLVTGGAGSQQAKKALPGLASKAAAATGKAAMTAASHAAKKISGSGQPAPGPAR